MMARTEGGPDDLYQNVTAPVQFGLRQATETQQQTRRNSAQGIGLQGRDPDATLETGPGDLLRIEGGRQVQTGVKSCIQTTQPGVRREGGQPPSQQGREARIVLAGAPDVPLQVPRPQIGIQSTLERPGRASITQGSLPEEGRIEGRRSGMTR